MASARGISLNIYKTISRSFSTTPVRCKRNFRRFTWVNRGNRDFNEQQQKNPDPDLDLPTYGVRETGYILDGEFHEVPEMIPQLVVPDLTDFKLKPYVSYNVPDFDQKEFTAKDLFDIFYAEKIEKDYKAGLLNESGFPLEPNEFEKITVEDAKAEAGKTGTDLFTEQMR